MASIKENVSVHRQCDVFDTHIVELRIVKGPVTEKCRNPSFISNNTRPGRVSSKNGQACSNAKTIGSTKIIGRNKGQACPNAETDLFKKIFPRRSTMSAR